jgi:hypothetical protein
MKRWLGFFILTTFLAAGGFAAGPGPQVVYFEQKVSINAESIPLSRLLQLWDQATGMHSTVPPDLANQTVSVNFSELPLSEAVRRIFEKIPLDYVFIEARGIIVTGRSQSPAAPAPPAASEASPVYEAAPSVSTQLLEKKPNPAPPAAPEPSPPVPTPFGPIPNSGQDTVIQLPPVWAPPSPPFFAPVQPAPPPPPANNQNDLFGPISIYRDSNVPPPGPLPK